MLGCSRPSAKSREIPFTKFRPYSPRHRPKPQGVSLIFELRCGSNESMKKIALLALLLSACATEPVSPILGMSETSKSSTANEPSRELGDAKNVVLHPTPTKPKFINGDLYSVIAKSVAPSPAPGSIEQRADELNLLSLQEMRTKADCDRAATEVKVTLANFFGGPKGSLTNAQIEKLAPFFEQIRNDSDFFIQRLKTERGRKRPFQYIKDVEPCVAREVTPAYPSGHATLSRLYALVLSDMYPSKTKELLKRADVIAEDRVLSGMHHRSDIIAGQALGERLYKEFSKSPEFKKELSELERVTTKVAR